MEEKHMVMIGVGAVLVIMTTTLLAVTQSADDDVDDQPPPSDVNRTNPLLLISLDGFRYDYLYRDVVTLETMAGNGVKALYMMPSYPTITFPNHYSIVTGMYPEAHGIISNDFWDPVFRQEFHMSANDGKFWGGEPIWNTLTLQNKTSAIYFWPGSDKNISGLYPTKYYDYSSQTSNTERIDKALEWLSMPEDERPDFVALYFEDPDHEGHVFGPDTLEVNEKLQEMDGLISRLFVGLKEKELTEKVNVIVLSDHGMAKSSKERYLNLTNYVPAMNDLASHPFYGPFTMLWLNDSSSAAVENVARNLSCPAGTPNMRAFLPKDLPKRFHYSNNRRIGDIVLDLDSGFVTYDPAKPQYFETPFLGQHGYENYLSAMRAFFIALGPDFKRNATMQPFHNIELYNLMCHLLDLDPAPNNGTEGTLYDALLDPPPYPDLPQEEHPPAATFPASPTNETLHMAHCPGDANSSDEPWLQEINLNNSLQNQLEEIHLPWGIPLSGNLSDILLLHHSDHVTAFSEQLKMPLWTSFTLTSMFDGEWSSGNWSSDVRLDASNTPSCATYDAYPNVAMLPLFLPLFSALDSAPEIPYLVSNAVPLVISSRFLEAATLLADNWGQGTAKLNVIIGVAFDSNADSFPDQSILNATSMVIPSHFFIVATRCRQAVSSVEKCKQEDLDAQSFIVPQLQTVTNDCLKGMKLASFHMSKVHDVELLTGLTFFPALAAKNRLQLTHRIHTHPWLPTK